MFLFYKDLNLSFDRGGDVIPSTFLKNYFHSQNISGVYKGMIQGTPSPCTPLKVRKFGYILPYKKNPKSLLFQFCFTSKKRWTESTLPPPPFKYKGNKYHIKSKEVKVNMAFKMIKY